MKTILFILALIPAASALSSIGCFSDIPSSYVSKGTYTWQSSSHCSSECSSYKYIALTNGNECYCGDDKPSSSDSSDSCDTSCDGYPSEKCGGSNAYTVYGLSDDDVYDNSLSSGASSSTGSSGASSSTSSPASSSTVSSSSSSNTAQTTQASSSSSSTQESTSSTETPTTSSESSSSSTSPTMTATVLTSTVSEEGSKQTTVVYITQSTSLASASASADSSSRSGSKSSNKGAIIGGAVGGAVGASIVIGGIFFVIFRRRRDNGDDTAVDDLAYEEALKSNRDPFASADDDLYSSDNGSGSGRIMLGRRRLSDGSLADAADYYKKVLKVANPDDDKN
ncbi:hypothetical protein KL921_002738 [Ogataea angusta]|uniref:WSC domain-containing protein n=1 Tax=Pichia angusta TaxID=870730 RepID=A0AAN6DID5_PICAN|nr:uncharacterized protein KL928_001550 [Ogataea angusta]KAG7811110.1 hypothetical protein KL921_002738 [Ogataea angusta]KAG7820113.1 hypothetical protein KL928_001550 [Ogataea angusta]KAG7823795.1 hypothetical protein KL909_002532 [Ogataea angusta]KAG7838348.1 hypothetical protein KL943_000424 [Ogataea angusta]KAG7840765.1 hypothetical protein KL942_001753 [Ogataea angusta]